VIIGQRHIQGAGGREGEGSCVDCRKDDKILKACVSSL